MENLLLHFNSTKTQKTFSQLNDSSPGQFLREHLLTSLMALHSSKTFFCGQQSMIAGLYEKRSLSDRATVTYWNSWNMVSFKGFCIEAVWQTRLFFFSSHNSRKSRHATLDWERSSLCHSFINLTQLIGDIKHITGQEIVLNHRSLYNSFSP